MLFAMCGKTLQLKAHLGGSFVCILHSFRPSLDGGPNGEVLLKTKGSVWSVWSKVSDKKTKKSNQIKSTSLLDGHRVLMPAVWRAALPSRGSIA